MREGVSVTDSLILRYLTDDVFEKSADFLYVLSLFNLFNVWYLLSIREWEFIVLSNMSLLTLLISLLLLILKKSFDWCDKITVGELSLKKLADECKEFAVTIEVFFLVVLKASDLLSVALRA